MKKVLVIAMLLCCSYGIGMAQELPKKYLSVQVDAFDFMAKGFSLWGVYTSGQNRLFLDAGVNALPDFLNPLSDDFIEKRTFFVQGGYYRFTSARRKLFLGGEFIFQSMEVSAKNSSEIQSNPVLRVAPAMGYEWTPFKTQSAFTIAPWMSLRLPLISEEVFFQSIERAYKTADINFVMECNLGLRFLAIQNSKED